MKSGKQIVPKDRSQPSQRPAPYTRGTYNSDTQISYKPVALQPFAIYDRPHDFNAAGGMDHLKVLKISYADYSQRPARKQVEEMPRGNMQAPEGCNEYNIWYGKWIGEQFKEPKELVAAATRCCVRRDAGKTKAEYRFGEAAYMCLFFARGSCAHGPDCTYLHRIPSAEDDKRLDMLHDIFGRERHASDRDDMRGVGSFNRNNRTLYLGGLKVLQGAEVTHRAILRHFSEWGEIEQLRLIPSKAIAFVRYKYRVCAEFALEAMHCQTMDLDELLNIRWAYEDPNPKAEEIERQRLQVQLVEAMEERGLNLANAAFEYPADYHAVTEGDDGDDDDDPSAAQGWPKRRRVTSTDYPNTDTQYAYLAGAVPPPPVPAAAPPPAGVEASARVMTREEAEREAARERAGEARRAAAATQDRLASILNMVDQVAAGASGADLDAAAAAAAAAAEAAEAADAADAAAEQAAAAAAAAVVAAARAPRSMGWEDWVECVDGEGRTYYHSPSRNRTTWDRPAPSGWDVAHAQAFAAAQAAAAAAAAAAARPPTWDPAWVAQYAKHYGMTFQQARAWLVQGVPPSPGFTGQPPSDANAADANAAQPDEAGAEGEAEGEAEGGGEEADEGQGAGEETGQEGQEEAEQGAGDEAEEEAAGQAALAEGEGGTAEEPVVAADMAAAAAEEEEEVAAAERMHKGDGGGKGGRRKGKGKRGEGSA